MDCETFHFMFFVTIRVDPNGQSLNSELICEYVSNFDCTAKSTRTFRCSENLKNSLTYIITPHIGDPEPVNLKQSSALFTSNSSNLILIVRKQYSNEIEPFVNYSLCSPSGDRLCGLVVRVSGYRYRGPGFDSRRYQIF